MPCGTSAGFSSSYSSAWLCARTPALHVGPAPTAHPALARHAGKPAIQKLRLVREVEQFMANRLLHEELLANNGLHALSQWIAPYEDGSLPNTKVSGAWCRL